MKRNEIFSPLSLSANHFFTREKKIECLLLRVDRFPISQSHQTEFFHNYRVAEVCFFLFQVSHFFSLSFFSLFSLILYFWIQIILFFYCLHINRSESNVESLLLYKKVKKEKVIAYIRLFLLIFSGKYQKQTEIKKNTKKKMKRMNPNNCSVVVFHNHTEELESTLSLLHAVFSDGKKEKAIWLEIIQDEKITHIFVQNSYCKVNPRRNNIRT